MKQFVCAWVVIAVSPLLAHSQTEVWYNWQGKPLGTLPAEPHQKIQASDLVKGHAALIRVESSPWAQRKWRNSYSYSWRTNDVRWHDFRYYGVPYLRCRPVSTPWSSIRYRSSGSWSVSIQRPGFSLLWRR